MDPTAASVTHFTEGPENIMESGIFEEPLLLLLVLKILMCVILVAGVFSNASIVILMAIYGFRNVSDVFIGIMCTSNFVFLLIFVPLELSEQNPYTMSLFMCRFSHTIHIYFCALSVLSLVVLGYERCIAVIRPMRSRGNSFKTTIAKIFAVVILAGALSAPFWFIFERAGDQNVMNEKVLRFAIYTTTVTLYVWPLLLITVMYTCMAATLMHTSTSLQESTQNRHVQSRRNRVSWIVIGLVVSFAVCWLPYYLFLILLITGYGSSVPGLMYFLSYFRVTIYTLNTCSDPMSIYLLGSRFRQNLQKAICRKKTKQDNMTSFQSSATKQYHQAVTSKTASLSVYQEKE